MRASVNAGFLTMFLISAAGCTAGEQDIVSNDVETGSGSQADKVRKITGTLAYRERIALRSGSVAKVWLLDTSRADVKATEIAHEVITDPGNPPIPFVLEFDASQIDERFSYSVRATIKQGDQLLFTTDTHYPVLTRGAGNTVDLMLVMVNRTASKPKLAKSLSVPRAASRSRARLTPMEIR